MYKISDEWDTPEKQPFKDLDNLCCWLEEEECRHQYSLIFQSGEQTSVFWNGIKNLVSIEERARWTDIQSGDVVLLAPQTETYVPWSPKGNYLGTFHQRGITLWGGDKFKQIQRFSYRGMQLINFSPVKNTW